MEILFAHCDENDHDVRLAAEENISKLVKVRLCWAVEVDPDLLSARI